MAARATVPKIWNSGDQRAHKSLVGSCERVCTPWVQGGMYTARDFTLSWPFKFYRPVLG